MYYSLYGSNYYSGISGADYRIIPLIDPDTRLIYIRVRVCERGTACLI